VSHNGIDPIMKRGTREALLLPQDDMADITTDSPRWACNEVLMREQSPVNLGST